MTYSNDRDLQLQMLQPNGYGGILSCQPFVRLVSELCSLLRFIVTESSPEAQD